MDGESSPPFFELLNEVSHVFIWIHIKPLNSRNIMHGQSNGGFFRFRFWTQNLSSDVLMHAMHTGYGLFLKPRRRKGSGVQARSQTGLGRRVGGWARG